MAQRSQKRTAETAESLARKQREIYYKSKRWGDCRFEQQAFAKHGLSFVLDTYLPEKLKQNRFPA